MKFGSHIVRGVFLLAVGKGKGIGEFGHDVDAFYASLAPLIAFPLVATVILGLEGQPALAAMAFLTRLCVVLFVPVAIQALAAWMGRDALWLRTATALNWSFWLMIPLLLLAGFVGALLVTAGVAEDTAVTILVAVLVCYVFWYQLFAMRSGLQVGYGRAFWAAVAIDVVIGAFTVAPVVIDRVIQTARF